ncbi:MAG: hypothetical protein JWL96_1645 [Sphingomonas bacterium]|nr:hypothetical protein [Sphingomonas bacterium]
MKTAIIVAAGVVVGAAIGVAFHRPMIGVALGAVDGGALAMLVRMRPQ